MQVIEQVKNKVPPYCHTTCRQQPLAHLSFQCIHTDPDLLEVKINHDPSIPTQTNNNIDSNSIYCALKVTELHKN